MENIQEKADMWQVTDVPGTDYLHKNVTTGTGQSAALSLPSLPLSVSWVTIAQKLNGTDNVNTMAL